jgi:GAF domain-containing protein
LSKEEKYNILFTHISLLIKSKDEAIKSLAQMSLMMHQTFGFWWTGFYLVKGKELVLGPYQGPLACLRIAYGRGVCGTAWKEGRTIIVPDVEEFPGHIACSSESRSEIVIPLRHEGEIKGVLDIDSEKLATFDDTDALWLEKITDELNLV